MKSRGLPHTACASHKAWWRNACLPSITTKPPHMHPDTAICTEPKHKLQDLKEEEERALKREREWADVSWRCHWAGRRRTQRHSLAAAVTMGMHLTADRYDANTTDTVWLAALFSHSSDRFGFNAVMWQDPFLHKMNFQYMYSHHVWSIQWTHL